MFYPFGADITYTIYTGVNGEKFDNLPASQGSSGKLYLYSEKPTREDALAGTGAIGSAITLTVASSKLTGTIPAIDDPDPDGNVRTLTYWVAANFIKKTGGQEETLIRPIKLSRADAHDVEIGVAVDSVLSILPDLDGYLGSVEINGIILAATSEIKEDITAKGIEWASVHDPEQLYWVVLWRSLELVSDSQILVEGDRWDRARDRFEKRYTQTLSNLKLKYEADASGVVVGQQRGANWIIAVR
jgi:hypothetical protein